MELTENKINRDLKYLQLLIILKSDRKKLFFMWLLKTLFTEKSKRVIVLLITKPSLGNFEYITLVINIFEVFITEFVLKTKVVSQYSV